MTSNQHRTKSEEKRLQMLYAAGSLFLDNGFDGVSMEQIAAAAGVSKQTVYSHFGSKEELFSAIIDSKVRLHDLTDELFNTNLPIHKVLTELGRHLTDLLMSDDAIGMFRVCISEAGQRDGIATLYWKAGPERLTHRFTHYLQHQKDTGKLQIEQPHFAAQQFLSMLKGEAFMRRALGQVDDHNLEQLPDYLESCISLFEKAYLE